MTPLTSIMDRILTVRDQGRRPTCLAFAASEAHSISHNRTDWLSPEYLYQRAGARIPGWSFKSGLSLDKVVEAIQNDGQPDENNCPYQDTDVAKVQSVALHTDIFRYLSIKSVPTADEIIELSKQGSIFVLGLNITQQFHYLTAPFVIDDSDDKPVGGHAMVLAGVDLDKEGKKLFYLKNTWGSSWGHEGFAWVTESFLNKNLIGTVEFKESEDARN